MRHLLVALLLSSPFCTLALSPADAREELASEFAFCASYYSMGAVLGENSGHAQEAAKFRPTIEKAIGLSAQYSNEKKAQARLELAMRDHIRIVKEESFSRLILQTRSHASLPWSTLTSVTSSGCLKSDA